MGLAAQILYCIAVPATLVLVIQTVLMFLGLDDDGDFQIDAPETDLEADVDLSDAAGLDSLNVFTLRGILAFFVVFSWVGIFMLSVNVNLPITLIVAGASGFAMMFAVAYLFRLVLRLRSSGTTDNRNAVGSAGKVYLTIPPSRMGEGKINVMLQGAYVERNAVTDETEAIPTGCEIIVVGTSGQTSLVVKRK